VVISFLSYKERNVFVGLQSIFSPLNENFAQVPSGAINIKIYRARAAHTHTHIYIYIYVQNGFLSVNSFNKFPWGTNA
jgi:hypothetical protein